MKNLSQKPIKGLGWIDFFLLIFVLQQALNFGLDLLAGKMVLQNHIGLAVILCLLLLSYFLEGKLRVKREWQGTIYCLLFFSVGSWVSVVFYHNHLDLKSLVVNLCLSVIASMIWVAYLIWRGRKI